MSTSHVSDAKSPVPIPPDSSTADLSAPNASQILLDALEKSWSTYLIELARCRTQFSVDAVHDLRVATRRLMAVVQLLHSIEAHPRLKKIIGSLKTQLDQFDELRDTQVILAELNPTVEKLPDLQGFQNHQRLTEEKLLQTLGEQIKTLEITELSTRIHKTQDSLQQKKQADLGAEILQAVDDAYLRTRRRLDQVDLAQPPTIHRVRVAFKRFRYMVEIVHSLLADFPLSNLKWMNDYQTLMGNVQDAEVFIQRLGDYLAHGSLSDPQFIRRYYERLEAKAVTAFGEHMKQLNLFWRPAPDEPFPWERVE